MQNDHSRIITCHVALVRNPRSYGIDNLDECQTVSAKAHVQYDTSDIPHNIIIESSSRISTCHVVLVHITQNFSMDYLNECIRWQVSETSKFCFVHGLWYKYKIRKVPIAKGQLFLLLSSLELTDSISPSEYKI